MGTDRLYQVLPIMRELKKERREEVEQVFSGCSRLAAGFFPCGGTG